MRKLLISPWFGKLPLWIGLWQEHIKRIERYGYAIYMPTDFSAFQTRVKDTLGLGIKEFKDARKVCDFRPAFGVIYEKEIAGYDFWGHTDSDVVFGRLSHYLPDDMLGQCDVFSNDLRTICGPFSLFRNTGRVNKLFEQQGDWKDLLQSERFEVFDEGQMSVLVSRSDFRTRYAFWQPKNPSDLSRIHFEGDRLCDGTQEVMMCHFNRTKEWPCR